MEAEAQPWRQTKIETMYGSSLNLNIPSLSCSQVDCERHNVFTTPHDNVLGANVYLINMINYFVDFFIQYQTIDDEPVGFVMKTLLDLKKIIFSFCLVDMMDYFETFFATFQERYSACIKNINNKFITTENIGNPDASSMRIVEKDIIFKQKAFNLFLLGLSYKILSMSASLEIQIKDMNDIIRNEKEMEQKGKKSFILQFLPRDKEVECFTNVELFFFSKMNSVIFKRITDLAGAEAGAEAGAAAGAAAGRGGSKRLHNRSRKNKYKNKYKKSRKSKYSRRKRMQSNQNKMF